MRLLHVLFSDGSTRMMMNIQDLPKGDKSETLHDSVTDDTIIELFDLKRQVDFGGIILPELDKNKNSNKQKALIFLSTKLLL